MKPKRFCLNHSNIFLASPCTAIERANIEMETMQSELHDFLNPIGLKIICCAQSMIHAFARQNQHKINLTRYRAAVVAESGLLFDAVEFDCTECLDKFYVVYQECQAGKIVTDSSGKCRSVMAQDNPNKKAAPTSIAKAS